MVFVKASEKSGEYISSPYTPEPVASKLLVGMAPHSTPWLQTMGLTKHSCGSVIITAALFFLLSFFTCKLLVKLCAAQALTLK